MFNFKVIEKSIVIEDTNNKAVYVMNSPALDFVNIETYEIYDLDNFIKVTDMNKETIIRLMDYITDKLISNKTNYISSSSKIFNAVDNYIKYKRKLK